MLGARMQRMPPRSRLLAIVLLVAGGVVGCGLLTFLLPALGLILVLVFGQLVPAIPLEPIEGPETPTLLDDVTGWLIVDDGRGEGIEIVALPGMERHRFQPLSRARMHSAPDALGRFAYLRDVQERGRAPTGHAVHVASLIGGDGRELFRRPGGASWNGAVRFLELAPVSGWLALASVPFDERNPFPSPVPPRLEIWDVESGQALDIEPIECLNASWFPDAHRLVVERLVPPTASEGREPIPVDLESAARGHRYPDFRPSLEILELQSGKWTWLAWGSNPRVAPDGQRVLYRQGEERWLVVEIETRETHEIHLPGALNYSCGWLARDRLLYEARPTAGQDPGVLRTPTKAPQAMWTLKVASIEHDGFLTVLPSIGRFHRITFGPPEG